MKEKTNSPWEIVPDEEILISGKNEELDVIPEYTEVIDVNAPSKPYKFNTGKLKEAFFPKDDERIQPIVNESMNSAEALNAILENYHKVSRRSSNDNKVGVSEDTTINKGAICRLKKEELLNMQNQNREGFRFLDKLHDCVFVTSMMALNMAECVCKNIKTGNVQYYTIDTVFLDVFIPNAFSLEAFETIFNNYFTNSLKTSENELSNSEELYPKEVRISHEDLNEMTENELSQFFTYADLVNKLTRATLALESAEYVINNIKTKYLNGRETTSNTNR